MHLTIYTLLLGVAAFSVTSAHAQITRPADPLRVMSFNIRNSGMNDKANAWPHRRELFVHTVAAYGPDLLGVQEVLADQHDQLVAAMPAYTFRGVARGDGKRADEWALVAYRTDRFDELGHGDFWLSDTPDKPSLGWDAACIRICSWVRLRDKRDGRELVFADTHWDHIGKVARRQSAALIQRRLPELSAGAPVILVGDLNSHAGDDWVQSLSAGTYPLTDSFRHVHPTPTMDEATYHGFTGHPAGERIDFIFYGKGLTATAAGIDRTAGPDGRFPSDHFAVTATITRE